MRSAAIEFYPSGALIPVEKRTDRLFLRPLRASDVELDYDAVMSSAAMLRSWSQSGWPADDFTLAQNLEDLQRHEREHEAREAFTFTVLDPAGARCMGCIYLAPVPPSARRLCEGAAHPVRVGFWVRASEIASDLDRHLLACLREWLATEWRFDCALFLIAERSRSASTTGPIGIGLSTIGSRRQAALLAGAGLQLRSTLVLPDGRRCVAFS